jgi:DNA-binding NarL/FixJ family response regulator
MRDSVKASRSRAGSIRVLVFNECKKATPKDMSDYGKTIEIVGAAKTGLEALAEAAVTKPDVILMMTDSAAPTSDFTRSLRRFHKASLTGRVAIMAKHPAGYLRLAVTTRAAALLPLNARYDDVICGVSEMSNASGRSVPSWHLLTDVGSCGLNREVTDM